MNIPDAGSNFPLVRKQEPVKWDTSLGNFHNLTHWCIEYFNATGTMSHIAFTTIRSQQDGRIEGIGADARILSISTVRGNVTHSAAAFL